MIDRLDLETLSKLDEAVLLRWQETKTRYDAMELFSFHDQETRDAYFEALESLGLFEDSNLAALAREATAEDGEAAKLKLLELSLQIADLFPLNPKLIQ